ncbi:sensor histidine kinase [Luteimicrobium subarcticum]|uniref:histidine kinase n=1 Tax=Luteimicrobium subarcticum TaxID=620910 RepID=A0A2M8WS80_9MICO|nr:histidine kinase [Luteimicrobium subarcticum]PJI93789.1 histidine kinase [Luteimicrobium subarcticum]
MVGPEAPALALLAVTLLGCGAVLLGHHDPDRVLVALFLAAGAVLGVGAAAALSDRTSRTVVSVAVVGLVVLLPVAIVRASGVPWRHPLVRAGIAVCVLSGAVALVRDDGWVSGAALVAALVVVGCWWTAVELAPVRERPRLLWPVAAALPGLVLLVPVSFLVPEPWADVMLALLLVPVPVSLVAVRVRPVPWQGSPRRAVVEGAAFGAAAVLVFVGFVAVATMIGSVAGEDPASDVLGLVAVGCAAVFEPVRRGLRGTAEAILYGGRQDPLAAAARVGAHVAEDPVPALRALVEVLDVPYARLEGLGEGGGLTEVAHVGDPDAPGDSTALALRLGEQEVGRLVLTPRRADGSLSASDARVVAVVAPALAQTLRARRLALDLAESRGRTLVAAEEERRRVRRDLHDGLGPTLSGIAYTADAASNTLGSDAEAARTLVDRVRQEARAAVSEVRRIVEGMRPPALDELGLVGALDQRVATMRSSDGAPLVVDLTASASLGTACLSAAVEVAAYRIVLEAVTNVARHARTHRAEVVLVDTDEALVVEVHERPDDAAPDDAAPHGGGPPPGGAPATRSDAVPRIVPGVGIASMRERAAELGGSVDLAVQDGGVLVRARLPHPGI